VTIVTNRVFAHGVIGVSGSLDTGLGKISPGTWVPGGTTIMEQYVALDVSLREISVCVIDGKGAVVFEGKPAADPVGLAQLIRAKAPQVVGLCG
jgi:hypothetical protein